MPCYDLWFLFEFFLPWNVDFASMHFIIGLSIIKIFFYSFAYIKIFCQYFNPHPYIIKIVKLSSTDPKYAKYDLLTIL